MRDPPHQGTPQISRVDTRRSVRGTSVDKESPKACLASRRGKELGRLEGKDIRERSDGGCFLFLPAAHRPS